MPNFPQNPYIGQIVTWQGNQFQWNGQQWVNLVAPNPTTVPVYISASPPAPPILQGSFWYNTVDSSLFIWVNELGEDQWVQVTGNTPPLPYVTVSISAPPNPENGALWYNPNTATLKIWVDTGLSAQWETITSNSPSPAAPCVVVSSSAPPNPSQGTLWYRPTTQTLSLWVSSLSGGSWVVISTGSPSETPTVYVSISPPPTPNQGDLWFQPVTDELKVWNTSVSGDSWLLIFDGSPASETPPVYISVSAPANPKNRYLWFNPQSGEFQVRNGSQWDLICTTCDVVPPPVAVSVSPPPGPEEGDLWFNPISGILSVWYVDIDGGQWLATIPYALIEAASEAAASAAAAAESAALAEYYAQQAAEYFGEVLIDSTEPGIIYVGKAPTGSLETAPVWTIRKSTYDFAGNLLTTGSAYNVAWTDRTTVIYT